MNSPAKQGWGYEQPDLLRRIERHIVRYGMTASEFGRRVCNDPRLIFTMRAGRQPGETIRLKIATTIAQQQMEASKEGFSSLPKLVAGAPMPTEQAITAADTKWRNMAEAGSRKLLRAIFAYYDKHLGGWRP